MGTAYTPEERAASNFKNDLADALPAEQLVLQVFSRLEKQCWWQPSEGYEPRGDMYCSHCGTWVEVKFDHLYGKTGNVFVEIDTLKHSQSKYMVFVVEKWAAAGIGGKWQPTGVISDFIYVLDFEKLRQVCRRLYRHGQRPIKGGEFGKMDGYALPLKALQQFDWCITIMTKATDKYASKQPIAELFNKKHNKLNEGTTDFRQRRSHY